MEAVVETAFNSGLSSTFFRLNFQMDKDCRNVIKNHLKSSKTRLRGLVLLNSFLDDCSDDVFIEDSSIWFQFAVDSIAECDSKRRSFAFEILAKFLSQLKHFPEAMKNIAPINLNKLLELILDRKSISIASLKCLEAYLITFSGQCAVKKNQIKQFIIDCVGNVNSNENLFLESCFAKLVMCGSAGHQSIHHQTEWINQINSCISNLYQLLSVYDLIGKVKEFHPVSTDIKKGDVVFELISGNAPNRCLKTLLQFEFLSGVIREMMKLPLQTSVKINIAEILNLIAATLSVGYNSVRERNSVDASILLTILPSMQSSALLLLKSLIQTCHSDLAIQSQFVNQLLLQILETTSLKKSRDRQKLVLILRKVCYDTLYVWFASCGLIASFDDKMAERFIKQLKAEFEANDHIELKDSKSVRKQDTHRQRRIPANVEQQCNEVQTCCLKAVNAFLINSCVTLSEQNYSSVSSFIINEILRIYRTGLNSQTNLYDSCRKALLAVLRSLVVNSSHSTSACLSIAVVVFNEALRLEMNANIKLYCNETLSIFHKLINPVMPIRQSECVESTSTCVNILKNDQVCGEYETSHETVAVFSEQISIEEIERDSCIESESLSKSANDVIEEEAEQDVTQLELVNMNDKCISNSNCEQSSKCDNEESEDSESEVEIIEEKQKQCNDDNVNGDVHDCPLITEKRYLNEVTEKSAKKLKSDACDSEEVENLLLDFVDIPAK